MLEIAWGSLMAVMGLLFFLGSTTKTKFVPYRLLEARARMIWKGAAPRFLQVVGVVLVAFGVHWATGVIWS